MKPFVQYTHALLPIIPRGHRIYLWPVRDRTSSPRKSTPTLTSPCIWYNNRTGAIHTKEIIYIPREKENHGRTDHISLIVGGES